MQHYIAYEGLFTALAQMQEDYLPDVVAAINRRIGIEGTLQRPPYSYPMGQDWVRGADARKGTHEGFAILCRDENAVGGWKFIGHTALRDVRWPDGTANTGSMIVANDSRGKGHGTEAKLLLLKHGFHILGLRKAHSAVKAWNAQSLGHLIKCGYSINGRRKAEVFDEGLFVDELTLEVFRADWEPVWDAYQARKELPRLTPKQRAVITKETKTE